MATTLLEISRVSKQFGGFTALDGVSIAIQKGERFGLIGPNGSGKTTLINCVSGALANDGGRILFNGEEISRLPAYQRTRRGIARSFQIPRPFGSMSVLENLVVPLEYVVHRGSLHTADTRGEAMEILRGMGLAEKAETPSNQLSQVELRKLELARAMAARPQLLISDEAMAGLSGNEITEVLEILFKLNATGITVIMIEHIMQAVMKFSQRVVCLDAGRIICEGTPGTIVQNADVQRAYLALELTVKGVDAGYGAVRALHDFSLVVNEKETVALLGTNGNGKSTLMKCVMGMVRPTRGIIELTIENQTHDLTRLSTEEIVNLGVALVPEGRRLFPKLTVEENLLLGAFRPQARAHIAKNIALCYETFDVLKERRRQLAGSMSGGQQQMLAIARALMSSPKLLLVDEPSVGLSPLLVSNTVTMIKSLKDKYGLTVLMAEQNFHQAIRIADRGYIIVHGEIVFEGKSVAELENNPLVKNYYLGTS